MKLPKIEHFWPRFIGMLIGVFFMGFSLSLLKESNFGIDPYACLSQGFTNRTGVPFGTSELIFNGIMLIFLIIFEKRQIGLGTVGNMVLIGYTSDFFTWIWRHIAFFNQPMPLQSRIIVLVPAFAIFILAASAYMAANLGMSPYDAMPFIISHHTKKLSFRVIRVIWDAAWVGVGFLLSGPVGIITVLVIIFMGPIVSTVGVKIADNIYKTPLE